MTAEESSDEKMPPNEAESAASNAAATKMDPETEPLNAGATADPKVKFTGGTETVDVEYGGLPADDGIKPALTKAELMKYASDPFWVRMRWILFVLFWIGWTAMLVTSIVIIIMAPKCPSPAPKSWWQKRPFYQIRVNSFHDSDGDGTGDLPGILEKVDYLDNKLGVGSVGLSPIFKSQDDYKTVNADFGTAEDFKKLVDGLHDREIKVVLDLFPEHTATQAGELKNTMKFWLSQGVDGFRVNSVGYQNYDADQTLVLLQEFRNLLDEAEENEGSNILITNVEDSQSVDSFYGVNITDHVGSLSQMPVPPPNVLPKALTAENLKNYIEEYTGSLPADAWPNFSLGKHGVSRVATRTKPDLASTLNLLLMLLPGTPITYYGEEIGMVDGNVEDSWMQWTNLESEENTKEKDLTSLYLEGTSLRESETILFGSTNITVVGDVFILARVKKGNPGYIFISNFGDNDSTVKVKEMEIKNMAEKGILTLSIPQSTLEVGDTVAMEAIEMPPHTTFLVTFVPNFD